MPVAQATKQRAERTDPLAGRAGLTVPEGWWASVPLLKSLEAAGLDWAQLHAPPVSVLRDPLACAKHAAELGRSLSTTALGCVIHAPQGLRAGDSCPSMTTSAPGAPAARPRWASTPFASTSTSPRAAARCPGNGSPSAWPRTTRRS
jgi:hypothetical protein